jgi:hypothetical protein
MSAYAQLNGHFHFNRTPLAPPGTHIIAHEKPDQRASCNPHGVDGYYLGPALDHYRCYQVHITKTKGTRIVDTVEFFPSKSSMPETSSKDFVSIAALKLSHALQIQPQQRRLVTLERRNFKHCANFRIFFLQHFRLVQHNMHPRWHKTPHTLGALFNRVVPHTLGCQSNLSQPPL